MFCFAVASARRSQEDSQISLFMTLNDIHIKPFWNVLSQSKNPAFHGAFGAENTGMTYWNGWHDHWHPETTIPYRMVCKHDWRIGMKAYRNWDDIFCKYLAYSKKLLATLYASIVLSSRSNKHCPKSYFRSTLESILQGSLNHIHKQSCSSVCEYISH